MSEVVIVGEQEAVQHMKDRLEEIRERYRRSSGMSPTEADLLFLLTMVNGWEQQFEKLGHDPWMPRRSRVKAGRWWVGD